MIDAREHFDGIIEAALRKFDDEGGDLSSPEIAGYFVGLAASGIATCCDDWRRAWVTAFAVKLLTADVDPELLARARTQIDDAIDSDGAVH